MALSTIRQDFARLFHHHLHCQSELESKKKKNTQQNKSTNQKAIEMERLFYFVIFRNVETHSNNKINKIGKKRCFAI